ncbi:hypothetical protein [Pseudokineococcus lusitanus]|uniref:Uncharacterized protein n=1 Tax=Pseudokineococcus lusitanus TaxID=763993 RepID=A0A3N1HTY9_9ACTN|nr:hypothetical protein [Pseudokineococcus lusitanus]ROP45929.1 hypothetical protein EDC03_0544 [Pseudokineococcus lusitanus]
MTTPPADHPALDLELPAPASPPTATRRAASSPTTSRPPLGVTAADVWWDGLSPDRRAQIHRWITQRAQHHDHVDGQLDALDHLATEQPT